MTKITSIKSSIKAFLVLALLCIMAYRGSANYCSAYCSYYNLGNIYAPMCTSTLNTECTKCDEYLFTLNGTKCIPHGKFNQTLEIIDLNPPVTNSSYWVNTTNLVQLNLISGLYQVMEFYQDPAIPAGGNDLYYRVFTNLPPHFTIRLRFFVIRSAAATVQFDYYLDDKKYNYNYNQYPSNMTLGDIVTTDKIFHQNSNLTVGFQANFAAGVTESIGIKEVLLFISKCSQYCLFCSNSTNCVKCGNYNWGNFTYLYNGKCYSECPQQTYANDTDQTCKPCETQCQNCIGLPTNCTQCKFEGKHETFLFNHTCFYNCPNGYFKDYDTNQCTCPVNGYFINITTSICQPCANQCNSCFGTSLNSCYNCSVGYFLLYGTTSCSNNCPAGYYGDELARKCVLCSSICSECTNNATQCTSCFFRFSAKYLYNYQCLSSCPSGYEQNFSLRKCVPCPPYYYSYNGDCLIECPQNYIPNNETKSCLNITQTNFTLIPSVNGIDVQLKGKSISFSVIFQQGLSDSSKSWLSSQGYYNVNLKIDQRQMITTNIKLDSDQVYTFSFTLDQQLDESTIITIDFGTRLRSPNNISYSRASAEFSLSSNPVLLNQFYKQSTAYYLNVTFIPIVLIMIVLLWLRVKQSYDMLIQSIRAFQMMALAIFISYPLQSPIFSFLQGLNYFNLEFFPNIYNWFVPTFKNSLDGHNQFAGFKFLYGDMDFIRMIGSILVFIAVWVLLIVLLKVFFIKNNLLLGWLLRLGMQLIQVKILHSFWNSLIFTILISSQNNLYILWLHLFSYVFMGFIIFRYYKIYRQNGTINVSFLWRVTATLLLSVAVYQQMVLLIVLSLVSAGFGLYHYNSQKQILKSVSQLKYAIAFKLKTLLLSLLPWISIFGISVLVFYRNQMSWSACVAIVTFLAYLIMLINVIAVILMKYFFDLRVAEYNHIEANNNESKEETTKRITAKQIVQEHLNPQINNRNQLETIISQDSRSIVTEKEVFIKNQFEADFHNAHKKTIPDLPDLDDSSRHNQTGYQKSKYNQSNAEFIDSSLKQQLTKQQSKSQIKPLKKNPHLKSIQTWENNDNQVESIYEEAPMQKKFLKFSQTQDIQKSKNKLSHLKAIETDNQQEADFENIQLTKRSSPQNKKTINQMNATTFIRQDGIKRFNTVELSQQIQKNNSSNILYNENEEPKKLQGTQELKLRSNVFLRDEQESP